MKTKTALIIAILLGLFTYTLPLYAADKEYHVEERTVIEIPVVGKITTLTSTHLSGCLLKENTEFKMHNALIKVMSGGASNNRRVQLTDMCEEKQWQYNENDRSTEEYTFAELRAENAHDEDGDDVHIDMGLDQNDMDDLPRITRDIQGVEKNINGQRARKVVTRVHFEESKTPLLIEEYYTTKAKALSKVSHAREDMQKKMGKSYDVEGVPEFIKLIYREIQEDQEWARPDGEVIRLSIQMLDKDEDPVFSMKYDVTTSEVIGFDADHFSLK